MDAFSFLHDFVLLQLRLICFVCSFVCFFQSGLFFRCCLLLQSGLISHLIEGSEIPAWIWMISSTDFDYTYHECLRTTLISANMTKYQCSQLCHGKNHGYMLISCYIFSHRGWSRLHQIRIFFMAIQSGFFNNLEGWSIHFQRAILMVIGMDRLMVIGIKQ